MSNIALFHGTGSAPGDFWFPWLKDQLELRNHTLWVPQLPNTEEPSLSEWLPFVLQKRNFLATQETILIGHSAGCPLILSVLEKLGAKIKKTVLVAGFAKPLNSDSPQKILQDTYDWDTIRSNAGSVITINSDNDPWGCDEKAGHYIFEAELLSLDMEKGIWVPTPIINLTENFTSSLSL